MSVCCLCRNGRGRVAAVWISVPPLTRDALSADRSISGSIVYQPDRSLALNVYSAQRYDTSMLPLGIALLHKPEVNQVLEHLKHGPPCLPHLPNPQTLL